MITTLLVILLSVIAVRVYNISWKIFYVDSVKAEKYCQQLLTSCPTRHNMDYVASREASPARQTSPKHAGRRVTDKTQTLKGVPTGGIVTRPAPVRFAEGRCLEETPSDMRGNDISAQVAGHRGRFEERERSTSFGGGRSYCFNVTCVMKYAEIDC